MQLNADGNFIKRASRQTKSESLRQFQRQEQAVVESPGKQGYHRSDQSQSPKTGKGQNTTHVCAKGYGKCKVRITKQIQ